jgi:hypothetical protein
MVSRYSWSERFKSPSREAQRFAEFGYVFWLRVFCLGARLITHTNLFFFASSSGGDRHHLGSLPCSSMDGWFWKLFPPPGSLQFGNHSSKLQSSSGMILLQFCARLFYWRVLLGQLFCWSNWLRTVSSDRTVCILFHRSESRFHVFSRFRRSQNPATATATLWMALFGSNR